MAKKRQKETVVVTGGAGFIGSQLATSLVKKGYKVVVIDDLSFGRRAYVPKEATFIRMNIADPKITAVFMKVKPTCVFHLAAQIDLRFSVKHPIRDAETNIHGSLRVLDAAVQSGVRKFIFSSSGGALYSNQTRIPTPESVSAEPISPYGIAKHAFELYLRSASRIHGISYVSLRYANVYGPRQDLRGEAGVIGIFVDRLLHGVIPTINGDGGQTRDFVFVEDVVRANIAAMKKGVMGTFNIGTGKETSVNEVVDLIRHAAGVKAEIPHGPAMPGEDRRSALDIRLAGKVLGWKPRTDIRRGIRLTVGWFRDK